MKKLFSVFIVLLFVTISLGLHGNSATFATSWDKTFPKSDRVDHQKVSILIFSCQQNNGGNIMNNNTIFPKGDQGPKEYFTKTTWVKMLFTDEEKAFDTQVYNVTFEPAARTHWHSHPGGQILLVTKGTGYYQEKGKPARKLTKGDVVAIPPDVNHWHGAAPDEEFVHIGMSTQVHLGPAEWFGLVTDEEYNEATAK